MLDFINQHIFVLLLVVCISGVWLSKPKHWFYGLAFVLIFFLACSSEFYFNYKYNQFIFEQQQEILREGIIMPLDPDVPNEYNTHKYEILKEKPEERAI